ncbi:hypothetical protein [Streptomyces luteolus]|uniref:Integral membrane protein n=1 Tax=Streptomyces luteolus TaxID=3043615 RepID=A0ABT6SW12_9ACTN|nr:hypothetical protein [Streptomyces sp. B-S-A12]MDI3419793.1 hypothetical protein [Streptomyces sp. B-S-A12]
MTETTTATTPRPRHPIARGFLWLGSALIAFAGAFWFVTATADLALSAGLYGTPGTYKVSSCYDTDSSRKNSDYSCYGDFTPDGGYTQSVELEDTGHDYPDGYTFDVRQGDVPEESGRVQRTGVWGVAGELWQVGVAVVMLAWVAYMGIKPPVWKPDPSGERSRRTRVADRIGIVFIMGGIAVGALSWVVNFVGTFVY